MIPVFDLHTDVLNKLAGLSDQVEPPCVTAESLAAGGVTHLCAACFCGRSADIAQQLVGVKKQLALFGGFAASLQGATVAHLALEGLDYATEDVLTQLLQDYSFLYATLTWNHTAGICGSCLEDFPLTEHGMRVVRLLEGAEVRIDLSHAGEKAFFSCFDQVEAPIVTHAGVRSLTDHPRNLTDAQIRMLLHRDSLFGITFYTVFIGGGLDELVKQILYVLDMGGEDCLALGSDFDGCSSLPEGLQSPAGYPLLAQKLFTAGVSLPVVEKIFYKNAQNKLLRKLCKDGSKTNI